MVKDENKRQYKVIDQMLSMHAFLRDRYQQRALILKISLLVVSVFLCAFVFADNSIFVPLGFAPESVKFGVGLASLMCFALSLIESKVDWQGRAALHSEAVKRLAILKSEYRESYSKFEGKNADKNKSLSWKFTETMGYLVEIPEKHFPFLKAKHLRKIMLSKAISNSPNTPVTILHIKLLFLGFKKGFSCKDE